MTTVSEMLNLSWVEEKGNPIIQPPFPSPIIADPTFLTPSLSPDGKWHLFAHSLFGIHHFISEDGMTWKNINLFAAKSIRPYILKFNDVFYLLTERILEFIPYPKSRIEIRQSLDLQEWSDPVTILEPHLPWHFEGTRSGAIGNPCIVVNEDGYFSLYYSAASVFLSDCFFSEPKYVGLARSKNIFSGYEALENPILYPSFEDRYCNFGAGSIKVLRMADGYVGFQNGIYWDIEKGHSGSALRVLSSQNGINWVVKNDPFLKPDFGWKKSHVYAMDIRNENNIWIVYFNARSGWVLGKERIGRVTAHSA